MPTLQYAHCHWLQDQLRLDLVVPGPVFAECTTFNLHVTWPSIPTHTTSPCALATLPQIPSLIDCGMALLHHYNWWL
jgi:hypothetical protein